MTQREILIRFAEWLHLNGSPLTAYDKLADLFLREHHDSGIMENNLFRKPVKPTLEDIGYHCRLLGGTPEMAAAFAAKYDAVGWYLNSSPIVNFKPLLVNFIRNWKQNAKHNTGISQQRTDALKEW